MTQLPSGLGPSLVLHAGLATFLLFSFNLNHMPQPELNVQQPAPVIQATAVDRAEVEKKLEQVRQQEEAAKRAEQQRIAEQKRKRKEELERREAEKKRKQRIEQERIRAAEAKKRQQEDDARKAREEAARKEDEKKKAEAEKQEAERKRKEEAKRKAEAERKAEQERLLQEQIRAEQAARARQRSQQVLSEVQKYQALIKQTIQQNLIVDDSQKGKSCRLHIKLASNGLVTKVDVLGGDNVLCRAAQAAVYRADTLPVSPEPDVYEKLKDINLTVEPGL